MNRIQRHLALHFALILGLALAFTACDTDDGDGDPDMTVDVSDDMEPDMADGTEDVTEDNGEDTADTQDDADATELQTYEIQFAARIGSEDFACGTNYMVGNPATEMEVKDFRFYVSNVGLITDEGTPFAAILEDNPPFQREAVALLDFEDGTAGCADNGTTEVNTSITVQAPAGETYTGIQFDLGVQFEDNHQDVAAGESPLDLGAMFWVWQGGYKFVRVDMVDPATSAGWNVHLGSTGCESPAPAVPPTEPCAKPNLPFITLDNFDPESQVIVADLGALLANSDVTADTMDTPPGCQSFPPDVNECTSLFPHLGISFETGECENGCADQDFFSVE